MKEWDALVIKAEPFIRFLERPSFFDQPFSGDRSRFHVLTDAKLAHHFAVESSGEDFTPWESVTTDYGVFPEDFDCPFFVNEALDDNKFINIEQKNMNGADDKWTDNTSCQLIELMGRDMKYVLFLMKMGTL